MGRARNYLDDRLLGALGCLVGVGLVRLVPHMVLGEAALIPGSDVVFIRGSFFPTAAAALIAVTGLWLLSSDLIMRRLNRESAPWPVHDLNRAEIFGGIGFLIGAAAYVALVIHVSFTIASAVVFFLLARWLGGKYVWALVLAVATAFAMDWIFGEYLRVPLPGRLL